jgi:hypothetical protein
MSSSDRDGAQGLVDSNEVLPVAQPSVGGDSSMPVAHVADDVPTAVGAFVEPGLAVEVQAVPARRELTWQEREREQTTLGYTLVRKLQRNEDALSRDPQLPHITVAVDMYYSNGEKYRRCPSILLVQDGKVTFDGHPTNDFVFDSGRLPTWHFRDLGYSSGIREISGNAFQCATFARVSLADVDLSAMVTTSILFGEGVAFANTKFPAAILEPGVLVTDDQVEMIEEQLQQTCAEYSGQVSRSMFSVFGSRVQDSAGILATLRREAAANPGGPEALTLASHSRSNP